MVKVEGTSLTEGQPSIGAQLVTQLQLPTMVCPPVTNRWPDLRKPAETLELTSFVQTIFRIPTATSNKTDQATSPLTALS